MGWVTAAASIIAAVGTLLVGVAALFTYRQARAAKEASDGARKDTNSLVAKIAYIQGRQDAIIGFLRGDRDAFQDFLPGAGR